MGFLANLLTGAASGGVFGLLGSLIGVGTKIFQAKQEAKAKEAERAHELKLLALHMEQGDRETENELAITLEKGAADARTASYSLNMGGETSMWVRDIRGIFRPALTVWLWIMIPVVIVILRWVLPPAEFALVVTVDLVVYMVQSLVFAASSATTWWFGDRAFTPAALKHR